MDASLPPTLSHLRLPEPVLTQRCDELTYWLDFVQQAGLRMYLLLDAVWAEDLARTIRSTCEHWEPLEGEPQIDRNEAHPRAPLLVDLTAHRTILRPWVEHCFLARIGVLVVSQLPMDTLRTSLKRFGLVTVEDRPGTVVFRYFDAEVMDAFLHASHAYQRKDFFERLNGLILPNKVGDGWTIYEMRKGRLVQGRSGGADVSWQDVPLELKGPPDILAYEVSFPFRTLMTAQIEAMDRATRLGFHREIARFIMLAFPSHCAIIEAQDLLELVARAHDVAERQSVREESAACKQTWRS